VDDSGVPDHVASRPFHPFIQGAEFMFPALHSARKEESISIYMA